MCVPILYSWPIVIVVAFSINNIKLQKQRHVYHHISLIAYYWPIVQRALSAVTLDVIIYVLSLVRHHIIYNTICVKHVLYFVLSYNANRSDGKFVIFIKMNTHGRLFAVKFSITRCGKYVILCTYNSIVTFVSDYLDFSHMHYRPDTRPRISDVHIIGFSSPFVP